MLNARKHILSTENTVQQFSGAQTMWKYEAKDGVEIISAPGPTDSEVILMVSSKVIIIINTSLINAC